MDNEHPLRHHPHQRTVFMRTFLPWQAWRFAVINMKMINN